MRWTPPAGDTIFAAMSKTSKSVSAGDAADMSFSDALQKLQRVVEEMEQEDLPLETMLARYEDGMKLARACEAKLAAAEVKIQQLETNAAGRGEMKPLAADTPLGE